MTKNSNPATAALRTAAASSEKTSQTPGKLAALLERLQRTRPVRTITHLGDSGGEVLAAGMSFQALFAVFAALWVGFSAFGFYLKQAPEVLDSLIDTLNTLIPGIFGPDGAVQVQTLLDSPALGWSSAVAMVSLFLLVLTWFNSTRSSIRLLFNMDARIARNGVLMKLRDVGFALGFALVILLSSAVSVGTSALLSVVRDTGWIAADSWVWGWAGTTLRIALMFVMNWFILFAIHRWLAELELSARKLWRGTLPGAIALVVLTLLGSALLGGASKNPLLASFAVIVGLLIWFNFICRVLLLTSAWIATGTDKTRGLPPQLRDKDAQLEEQTAALNAAGIAADAAGDAEIDITNLEPAARLSR